MTTHQAAHVAVLEALKSAQTLLVCVCSQSLYTRQDLIIQAENIDDQITAAIDLMKQAGDWVLVPREPTPEMVDAGYLHTGYVGLPQDIYAAMLAAAPAAQDQGEG
jgi:hypothetical protein